MLSLVQTKAIADTLVKSVLSYPGFVVPIANNIEKIVYRAGDEHHLQDMK